MKTLGIKTKFFRDGQCLQPAYGMTLIELLVSLVVVSLGLLGVSGLQARSFQFSNEAYYLTQAAFLGESMMERIRANHRPTHSAASVYNIITSMTPNSSAPSVPKDCASSVCSQSEMARYDVKQWLTDLDDLPGSAASLNWSGTTATIVIRWQGRLSTDGNCDVNGQTSGSLVYRCFTLTTTFPT